GRAAGGRWELGPLRWVAHGRPAAWEDGPGGPLPMADYLACGGIKDALTQTAERAYGSLSPYQQRLARRLFLRLVHVADDLPPSRATVGLGELRDWGDPASSLDRGSADPAPGDGARAPRSSGPGRGAARPDPVSTRPG